MSDENERTAAESNAGGGEAGASTGPRAGWYPDPAGSPRQRWWDGSGWTESLRDAPAATPVAPVPPVAPAAPVAPPSPPLYGQTSSGQTTSYGQSASGRSASGPAAPGPIASGAVPGQQAPAQPQYGQQTPAQPQYGQQAPAQPQYGQQNPSAPQNPYAQQNPYGQQNPYAPQPYASAPRSTAPQPRDPGIVSSTPWIWVVVLLPLLSALSILLLPPDLVVESAMSSAYGPSSSMGVSTAYLLGLGAVQVIGFLIYAAEVVFAFLDWRQLKRAGIQRPFHWAWAFLAAPYVYVIGRSVVVKRVTGGGLLPLWILLGVIAVSFVVGIVWAGALLSEMSQSFPSMMY
ncbi:DUF2510 domain-containing protein [Rathayibacter sp. ZW T2_19]|uniref:DUF2510 domain-containing protein n=1 Tax=Rathayibacter rubneri TaxID=2950106 RepID=A0A9X2DXV5_9MICO|nr:DUF2510 domain-containing protein [Rathayibacter rubneri]MCM6762261.1 DUF2510 domain-containing protein [Rathayibacter rubneri]